MLVDRPERITTAPLPQTCPNVTVTPGAPGTAPATWGTSITLTALGLLGFGVQASTSKVSLRCSDGRTLLDALSVVTWSPQEIVCTLPAKGAVAACDVPLYFELWVTDAQADTCGPFLIDIIGVVDPTQPASVDPADLTELARGFTISVTTPGPGPLQTGVPVRAQLVPPLGSTLPFTGVDGLPLPLPHKRKFPVGPIRLQSMEIAAAARRGQVPPLVVRSEQTYAALAAEAPGTIARLAPGPDAGHTALLPPAPPGIVVEVVWSVTALSLFGSVNVDEGSLFTLVDPDDVTHGVAPTLVSQLLGILFRPWITALTDPPTQPRQVAAYFLNARIRLGVGTTTGEWVDLASVQLPVPTLAVPALLLLFRDPSFTGRVLPCVPASSLYNKVGPLKAVLGDVRTALAPLESIASVAGWLLGLDKLLSLMPVDDNTTVAVADLQGRIDLDNYELDHSALPWNWDEWDWEDQVSSILLFGPPAGTTINSGAGPTGSSVAFYSAPDWSSDEGQYNIDIGFELSVLVPSLTSTSPTSFPNGALTVVRGTSDDDFNDVLSTLKFL